MEASRCFRRRRLSQIFLVWAAAARSFAEGFAELASVHERRSVALLQPVLHSWLGQHLHRRSQQVLKDEVNERCRRLRTTSRLYAWVRATVVSARTRCAFARRTHGNIVHTWLAWRQFCTVMDNQRLAIIAAEKSLLHPTFRLWKIALLQRRARLSMLRLVAIPWRVAVIACRLRRGLAELLQTQCATRQCREALFQLRREKSRCRVQVARDRLMRSTASRALARWLSHAQASHAVVDRLGSLHRSVLILRLQRGLARWHHATRSVQISSKLSFAVRGNISCSQKKKALVVWRYWSLRRGRNRALVSGLRSSAGISGPVFDAWRVACGCSAAERAWVCRVCRWSWSAWRACVELRRKRLTIEAVSCAGTLRRAWLVWRRCRDCVAAVSRLPAWRAKIQERLARDSISFAFNRMVHGHIAFQSAIEAFASQHPVVPELLQDLLEHSSRSRKEALITWHDRAARRRMDQERRLQLRQYLQLRALRLALRALVRLRGRRQAATERRVLVTRFHLADIACLRALALRSWSVTAAAMRRASLVEQLAQDADYRRTIGGVMRSWARTTTCLVKTRTSAQIVEELHGRRVLTGGFCRWHGSAAKATALRLSMLRFVSLAARRLCLAIFRVWRAVAEELVSAEMRFMLHADDLRSRSRKRLIAAVSAVWRSAAICSKRIVRQARLSKVFVSWHLHVQEQVLLRRYMRECSVANFAAGPVPPEGGSVRPADFESLYEQMAEQRWGMADILASD
eukprot:TRINITY_DN61557_c0_g1_i1.p1 TRINITY_DN61557_c0_g1~~TRINITY_DN61557_c0_g1_i1.p1  ORF type:complete len:846 (-),score=88.62 TRINITY_DN61557_c0_g1_i1:360-2591(-)